MASEANQIRSGPNQSRSPIRKKRRERHSTEQSRKQATDCSKQTSIKKKVSETTENDETQFQAAPDSQERIPISTTINFEDSTKDSTYQGQTARALRRDPAFNMSKPISASQQKLMWYIAMFQTRTMRMDDGLKMAFQWTLHKQVQARRAQGLPEVKLKSGEHPFQNNHETCCLWSADNLGCKGRQFLELQLANVLDRQVRLRRRRHACLKLDLLKVLWRPSTLEQSSPEKKPVLRGRGSKHPDVWLVALPCLEGSLRRGR